MPPLDSVQLHMVAHYHRAKPVHFRYQCHLSTFGNTQQQCAPDQDGELLVPGCNCFLVHAPCAGHTPAAMLNLVSWPSLHVRCTASGTCFSLPPQTVLTSATWAVLSNGSCMQTTQAVHYCMPYYCTKPAVHVGANCCTFEML